MSSRFFKRGERSATGAQNQLESVVYLSSLGMYRLLTTLTCRLPQLTWHEEDTPPCLYAVRLAMSSHGAQLKFLCIVSMKSFHLLAGLSLDPSNQRHCIQGGKWFRFLAQLPVGMRPLNLRANTSWDVQLFGFDQTDMPETAVPQKRKKSLSYAADVWRQVRRTSRLQIAGVEGVAKDTLDDNSLVVTVLE